jgi:hypothetical protein
MSLRRNVCAVLSWLNLHKPDCDHCAAEDCTGLTIGRRLRELNEPAQRGKAETVARTVRSSGNDAA